MNQSASPTAMRRRLLPILRLVISLGLISFLVTKIDLGAVQLALRSIDLKFILVALIFVSLHRIATIYKWNLLLRAKGLLIPFTTLAWLWLVNNFVGLFLPTTVGEDVARTISLGRYISDATEAASSVVVDRIVGVTTLLTVALGGAVLTTSILIPDAIIFAILLLLFSIGALVFTFNNRPLLNRVTRSFYSMKDNVIARKLKLFHESLSKYTKHKKVLMVVLTISFFVQFFRVLIVYSVSLSLNLDISVYYFFLFVPLIIFVTMLPISIGGIGVREGAYIYFFSHVGMPIHSAFVLSLLSYALTLVAALPGGAIYALIGLPKQLQVESSES